MSNDLHNRDKAIEFYDDRYEEGYMEEWDQPKKAKVEEIIHSLNLPEKGRALDFGCGNGVFTAILKKCLPGWDVFGVEISSVAVNNASRKFTECIFFTSDRAINYHNYFDFVFSHHVLEHVQDINETINQIDYYLKSKSSQLHILPCGNGGSYEYNVCMLHKNGIEKDKYNRFFFEEPGHLRRLTSSELIELMEQKGYSIKKQYFANQYYGAVNWITKSSPRFVKKLTNTSDAVDEDARKKLIELKRELLKLTYLQFPYSKYWMIKNKWSKRPSDFLKLSLLLIPSLFSKAVFVKYDSLANKEWETEKTEKNGSEMYLYFQSSNKLP